MGLEFIVVPQRLQLFPRWIGRRRGWRHSLSAPVVVIFWFKFE